MNYHLTATPPLSKGIANPRKYFKKIGIFGSALSTGVLIEPYYSAVFGQLIVGSFVHFGLKVTTKATGLTSSDYSSIISTVVSAYFLLYLSCKALRRRNLVKFDRHESS